jgi:hypothetical protein
MLHQTVHRLERRFFTWRSRACSASRHERVCTDQISALVSVGWAVFLQHRGCLVCLPVCLASPRRARQGLPVEESQPGTWASKKKLTFLIKAANEVSRRTDALLARLGNARSVKRSKHAHIRSPRCLEHWLGPKHSAPSPLSTSARGS